ncbi:hypothetical protein ACH492_08835 [Streptomyces sp. NPDC019443]|uniref:hypothetical protein n=1 Tax=Streptomyces sp. NPDC019443 TaxID=3365061 RepID=UPI0037AAB20F
MSTVSEILDSYARDWEIDQTPSSVISPYASVGGGLAPAIAAAAAVRDHLQKILDVLPNLVVPANMASTLDPFKGRYTGASQLVVEDLYPHVEHWTRASLERDEMLRRELVRSIQGLERGVSSRREETRSERALAAVEDLANWLGLTESKAADVAGGYRRSYYNWVKGIQPYEATTLNLFEAHAFVAALVDALDVRGAREWLAIELASRPRLSYLGDNSGRNRLSKLAAKLLFKPSEPPTWSPDEDARHIDAQHDAATPAGVRRRVAKGLAAPPKRRATRK